MAIFSRFGRKAQGSFEFIAIVGLLFLIVMGAIGLIQSKTVAVIKERNDLLVESLGNIVQSEVTLAQSTNGDYYRRFTLPYYVEGSNYTINMTSKADVLLYIEQSQEVIFLNSNITGTFQKGENYIRKANGVIYVNA